MALAVLLQRLDAAAGSAGGRIGLFVNENHFAVTANLLLPVLLALADRARFRAVQEGRPSSPAGLWLLASALVAAAVVASRSRAGIAVMTVLVGAHVVHRFRLVRQYPFMGIPQGRVAKWAGGLAVAAALAFAIAAFAREWRHVAGLLGEGTFRFGLLRDTLAVWRDSPVWGTGPGTFTTVFPYYQSVLFEGRVILHAHCEPVQWLAESGWAGGGILLAAAWMALGARRRNPENGPEEIPPFAELERNAVGWALAALAVHILIDFPLRIPLIALGAAVWAGLWAGQRPSRPTGT